MRIIEPSFAIENIVGRALIYGRLERAGRTCYKSEGKVGAGTAEPFLRRIIQAGHDSVLEHQSLTVRFVCDRGVSHELVRHRICAFSQESTRYCNYGSEKFERSVTFIRPPFFKPGVFPVWVKAMQQAETAYLKLLDMGATPQEARSVLPNSLKTEIVVTANIREWRHILRLRTSVKAHPQMQQLMRPLLQRLILELPALFDDLETCPPAPSGRAS